MAPKKKRESDRFWEKVDLLGPMPDYRSDLGHCWLWTGRCENNGYGAFVRADRRRIGAHRWAYLDAGREIPHGWHVDHLCRVRNCVNPAHLEAVTCKENHRRGIAAGSGPGAKERSRTHCPHGHPYTEENTIRRDGKRQCRECGRIRCNDRYHAAVPGARYIKRRAIKQ